MTLSILGQLDRDGCTVVRWDDAKLYRTRFAMRGHIRRAVGNEARLGWQLTKIERWSGQARGLACYLHFERAQ